MDKVGVLRDELAGWLEHRKGLLFEQRVCQGMPEEHTFDSKIEQCNEVITLLTDGIRKCFAP